MRCDVVAIGTELLLGQIVDTNSSWIGEHLAASGIDSLLQVKVGDNLGRMERVLRDVLADADAVIVCGGLGPTHDDLTIDGVARAFGVAVERSERMESLLRGHYGAAITDDHLLMARIPVGARLVATEKVPWPTVVMRNVWVLPGVPWIFAMKLQQIDGEIAAEIPFVSVVVLSRMEEALLKPWLDRIVAAHPAIDVGSYPRWNDGECKTRVTFDARDGAAARAARDAFAASLPEGALLGVEG